MNSKITYPNEPKKPCSKPIFEKGKLFEELPKDSLWLTHDPAIYHDPVSMNYYVYGTEAKCLRSKDMISWENIGKVVDKPSEDSINHVGTNHIWAPDIVKVGNEYRLYCSNSAWGVRQSAIFLAVADTPEGPFIPKGIVLKSSNDVDVNAIDANIIEDPKTNRQYMTYGSFWGGIHIVELDKTTGFAKEEGIGTCIAKRPLWCDGAIEGPYIIYNPDIDYYYLFVSYGSLKSDYNIRVARSKCVTGPYLDFDGREMTDLLDPDSTLGYMVCCGYAFDDGISYMAPGHNSVLRDFDNEYYLVSHIREHNFKGGEPSTMHIRKMLWSKDGWPVVSPEIYSGEKVQPLSKEDIIGTYERIKLAKTIPQGISTSVKMEFFENDTIMLADSIRGKYKLDDDFSLTVTYGNTIEEFRFIPAWDYELWKPTLVLTGKDNRGICIWAKKN